MSFTVSHELKELGLLGVGGMAEARIALQSLSHGVERRVVLKQLLPQYSGDEEWEAMLLDEARLAARLHHPGFPVLYGLVTHGGRPTLVFEYIEGPSLAAALQATAAAPGGPALPRPLALAIAWDLAQALHYLHELRDERERPLGIIHRDLSADNVLLDRRGAARLIDLGIARGAHRVVETATGTTKGTLGTMAPEQLRGESSLDVRVDIFAFGVLLHLVLTGAHPWGKAPPLQLAKRMLETPANGAALEASGVSGALCNLVLSCLSLDRTERPGSMAVAIERLAAELLTRRQLPEPQLLHDWLNAQPELLAPPVSARSASPTAVPRPEAETTTEIRPPRRP
jgi:serine/threonine protein kinase